MSVCRLLAWTLLLLLAFSHFICLNGNTEGYLVCSSLSPDRSLRYGGNPRTLGETRVR
jgi:hypothetical protein